MVLTNDITFNRTKNPNHSNEIFHIIQELLLTTSMYQKNDIEINKTLSQKGYVIGNHSVDTLKTWINNHINQIFVAQQNHENLNKIIGFVLLLNSEPIRKQVFQYGLDTKFLDEDSEQVFKSKKFSYLIQIGVKPQFQGKNIGSSLLQTVYERTNKPIISYVMTSPITNFPSVYFHLKNGFLYNGDYFGGFAGFPNYKSACFIYHPNAKLPTKNIIEERYSELLKSQSIANK